MITIPQFAVIASETQRRFELEHLVVAGGGGGSAGATTSRGGGGGGAGGYRTASAFSVLTGAKYPVVVGAGGTAGTLSGTKGNDSVFYNVISTGGGQGNRSNTLVGAAGSPGGSGGGASSITSATYIAPGPLPGDGNTPATSPSQGNRGGFTSAASVGGGGGGGATSVGQDNTSGTGGAGGTGASNSITGSAVTYATGGAGGNNAGGAAGAVGAANTGNGGGGGQAGATPGNGGAGGSGVVVLKVPSTFQAIFSAGVTSTLTTSVPGFNIYTVTATSTTSETVTFEEV